MIENHLFWSNRNNYSSINSASENELYNKMFWDSVKNLENEVKKIEEEIKAKKGEKKWLEIELKGTESGVFHKVTDYTCFKLMFWHQEEINKHLTIFLEKEYNQMWLDTPQKIKEMEREKSNYPSIFTILMNISSYGRTAIFRKIRNRATNEYAYKYYDDYVDSDTHDDNVDALDSAISTFKSNEDASYSKEIGLENYLLMAYGYDNKDDVIKYYYDASTCLKSYLAQNVYKEWAKEKVEFDLTLKNG